LRAWAPLWPSRLFDQPEHTAAELLQGEAWWQAMAVVRAERAEAAVFAQVLGEALRRLEGWAQQDRVDWQQLVKLVLHWALFRRPRAEHAAIVAAVRGSVSSAELVREVETMAEQLEQTYEQELLARGEARGEVRGEARGEARGLARGEAQGLARGEIQGELKAYRKMLRKQLERRFAALSEGVLQRIEAADLPALEAALDRADTVQSPEELRL
jgi:hypothetical protein